jgi:queuosine precursor transporter
MILISLYLVAIVLANLTVATFGPSWSVLNAFLFIGLDLTTRDSLHERWHGRHLWRNMAALILAGSVLSAVLNWQAAQIAAASCVAFAGAGAADALVYAALGSRARLVKVNGSNVVSAAVDSVLFPALAFGFPLMIGVMVGQFVAKVAGGFIWSLILTRKGHA